MAVASRPFQSIQFPLFHLKLKNCETEEDLQRVKQSCGDWVAGCGVPTVYTATMEDLPALIGRVVAHFSFHR